MAYFNQEQEETDKDTSQGMNVSASQSPAQATDQPVQLSNQSSVATSGAAPQAPKTAKPASSGSTPGFQNYTKANQGKAQENLNSATAKAVANSGQAATTAIQQANDQFTKKVNTGSLKNADGTITTREQALNDISNTVNSARQITAPQPGANKNVGFTPNTPIPAVDPGHNINGNNPVVPQSDKLKLDDNQKANIQSLDLIDPNSVNRFKEIINAQYQGPESLRQAGLYNAVSGKVDTAQNTIKNAQSAAGREEMLRNMYQQRADYTSGLNKLDSALVNSSKQGVQNLQAIAKAQGNLSQDLDKAQVGSANLATNRTNEINQIRNDARTKFSEGKKAEEAATEARLDAMLVTPVKDANGNNIMKADGTPMTQWDQLPESFKDVIRNKQKDNAAGLAEESAKLGTAPDAKSIAAAKKAMEKAAIGLTFADMDMSGFSIGGGGVPIITPEERAASKAKSQQAYEAAKKNYDSMLGQQNNYNTQLAALQQKYNPNAVNFNSAEAQILGIKPGEGLYNLGENAIVQGVADRNKLISRDEQARQAALAQLAGLDSAGTLDTNLKYDKADLAGTQNIMDSLDLDGTRARLNEADENFGKLADDTTLTGEGKKKVSRGNMFGKKTETYKASVDGNVGDMLEQAGYNFDGADANNSNIDGRALLNSAVQASKMSDNSGDVQRQDAQRQLQAGAQGAATGAALGSVIPGAGTGIGAALGLGLGRMIGSGTVDPAQQAIDLLNGYVPGVGQVAQDARNKAGDLYGTLGQYNPVNMVADKLGNMLGVGSLTGNISSAISGIDTGAMKEYGNAKARQNAIEDLQNKYRGFLSSQGFENRANVVNNDTTVARASALQDLLAKLDKTNT